MARKPNPWLVSIRWDSGTGEQRYGSEAQAYAAIRKALDNDTPKPASIQIDWWDHTANRWVLYERLGPGGEPA